MAGAMRKMAVYLGLAEDDDTQVEEYDDRSSRSSRSSSAPERSSSRSSSSRSSRPESSRSESSSSTRRSDSTSPFTSDSGSVKVTHPTTETVIERAPRERGDNVVRPLNPVRSVESQGEAYRISKIHPANYNDARAIGEEFRNGVPVIMNLTDMADHDAKRIIDFSAGLIFGLHGSLERITNKVFLLSPANVNVSDEARAQLARDGFFNQS